MRDFEYAGKRLSDFGFVICNFGGKGLETVEGVKIAFELAPVQNGSQNHLIMTQYEECLETTIQVCLNPCSGDNMEISSFVFREMTKWLCRKQFLKFKFLSEEYLDIYYESIINVSKIELDGKLVGLELHILCNRPFALKEPQTFIINNTEVNGSHSINDASQEEGFIYPHTEITVKQDGVLRIRNLLENRTTEIKGCTANEVITMDYPIISSNLSTHKIQNDFNWNFLRIANTYDKSRNDLEISLPCTIKLKYSPIVKVGL